MRRGARSSSSPTAPTPIFLADMSGDGLSDIVRVRNGEVCYWPNLGYGRFGAKVTMDRAPRFDDEDAFDAKRIRLADIDGSGTTDVLYVGARRRASLVQSVRQRLVRAHATWPCFPAPTACSDVQVIDLLGIGTACLVWSSPLPGESGRAVALRRPDGRHQAAPARRRPQQSRRRDPADLRALDPLLSGGQGRRASPG